MHSVFETAKILLANLHFNDIVDIIIVAYIIYKFIIFVRDSRSSLLFKGILIIVVALILSSLLQLEMVSYLIDMIISNLAIAIIVIFQPELRHVLERMGKSRLGSLRNIFFNDHKVESRTEQLNVISCVVESARILQKQCMGALIVFERDVSLSDIIATGSAVDAAPNVSILANIFFDKAPLHDGAVIIRSNRICAASCLLPLTDRTDLDPNLGTRHRAAIGMSEHSDAIVVVVSEESGRLSVCCNGEINSTFDPAELSNMLISILLPEEPDDEGAAEKSLVDKTVGFFKRTANDFVNFIKAEKKTEEETENK